MFVTALLTSLPVDFTAAVREVAALGFDHVDVVAVAERPGTDLEALAETGLLVSCGILARGLPADCALDAPSVEARRRAVDIVQRQLADAARLGATHAYLVPGTDSSGAGRARFAEACSLLADFAAGRMVRLCVEHMPGKLLPSAASALDWLEQVGHPNLALLLDVGHCLISRENIPAVIARAGSRLGYVHFDDNDGAGDLHWPLTTGKLTRPLLRDVVQALSAAGYDGALALELNPANADPPGGLRDGKALLQQLQSEPPA